MISKALPSLSHTCHKPPSVIVHLRDEVRLTPMKKALLILTAFFLTAAPLQPGTGAQYPVAQAAAAAR